MRFIFILLSVFLSYRIYSCEYGLPFSSYQCKYSYVVPDSIAHHDNFPTSNALPAHSLVVPPFFSSSHEHIFNRLEAEEHNKAQRQQHTDSYRASYNDANDHYVREQQLIEWASALTHNAGKCNEWTKAQYWNALRAAYCVAVPIVPGADSPLCLHYLSVAHDNTLAYFVHEKDLNAILHQWQLYDNAEFWRFIKELPQYDEWIKHLYTTHCSRHIKLSNRARCRLAIEKDALQKRKEAQRHVKEELQCRQQQEHKQKMCAQHEQAGHENEPHQLIQQTYAYGNEHQLYAVEEWKKEQQSNDISSNLYAALEQRLAAVAEIETHGLQYEYRSYSIEKETHSLLQKMSYDAFPYEQCYGNQLQHALHQECIQLIERTSRIMPTAVLYSYQNSIAQCVEAARTYTHEGLIVKASRITDFCWTLFDYGKIIVASAAKGALQGIVGIAQTALDHPLETALTAVAPEYMLAFQLARITFNCAEMGMTYAIDPQEGKEQWNDYIAPLTALIEAISSKQLSLAQTIQTGTVLAVGLIAQAKLLSGLNAFYSVMRSRALEWMTHNPLLTPSYYMATTEGSIFKATTSIKNVTYANTACPASCMNQYEYLKKVLQIEEFTSIINVTKHGIQRLIERGFTAKEVFKVIHEYTDLKTQLDGSKAYIHQIENNFNVIVINEIEKKVVTALKNIDYKAIKNLSKNYGWQ